MSRVAVITGGTVGIGRATARLFAEQGWSVGVIARDEARLRSTETELAALGVKVLGITADVADADAINRAADRFEAELGPVAAWVNNAMATVVSPARDITPTEYKRVTEVTYLGQIHGTMAAVRLMTPRSSGAIIQVSSALAIRSAPLQSAYCGAKAAVRGFTDSIRSELIHDNIKISLSVIYLPAVNTPQFDWARNHTGRAQKAPEPIFDPRLCADAILFAVDNPRREVWVGRSTAQMGALQRLSPHLADKAAARMWEAQLDDGPPAHPDGNLFEPVAGDPGIDGRFTDRSKVTRTEFWTSRQRDVVYGTLASMALLGMSGPLLMGAAVLKTMDRMRR